jgi:hypothetical protein
MPVTASLAGLYCRSALVGRLQAGNPLRINHFFACKFVKVCISLRMKKDMAMYPLF